MRTFEARNIPYQLIFTGQHKATMNDLLQEFSIRTPPEYLYDGPEISGIGSMIWWMPMILKRLVKKHAEIIKTHQGAVSYVLVHGDTFSTLIGALAGKLGKSKVVHIESGLRSFNWFHPFPEELTRLAVFRLADIAMCPGKWALGNMQKFPLQCIDTQENTLLDAVRYAMSESQKKSPVEKEKYCVASIHRFENIFRQSRLEKIIQLVELIAREYPVVFVLHPATEKRLAKYQLKERLERNDRIELVPRMTYIPFVQLIGKAQFVITDGGSNQEELSYMGIPTLLMRAATERQEGVGSTVTIANYDESIVKEFLRQRLDGKKPRETDLATEIQPSEYIVDRIYND